jgi:hypothetical protein
VKTRRTRLIARRTGESLQLCRATIDSLRIAKMKTVIMEVHL